MSESDTKYWNKPDPKYISVVVMAAARALLKRLSATSIIPNKDCPKSQIVRKMIKPDLSLV